MYAQSEVVTLLDRFNPSDDHERDAQNFIRDFVLQHKHYWSRSTLAGHLTASAWITNHSQTKAVLLHHKKLDIWVQPGGHIDDADETLAAASLREASEETGLVRLQLNTPEIFDLDVHKIPARATEPEHWHLDVRFWLSTEQDDLELSDESHALAWLSRTDIERLTQEESILRMVRKTLPLK